MPSLRFYIRIFWSLVCAGSFAFAGIALFTHPKTPLPKEWNPTVPIAFTHPVSPLSEWKLRRLLRDPQACLSVLGEAAEANILAPFVKSEHCHIKNRVRLKTVASIQIDPLETSCEAALRLAFWVKHGVRPAAARYFGQDISRVLHIGSYNCRQIRGASRRMSTHATASAIDISGFVLPDGRTIKLKSGWSGLSDEQAFFRDIRDASCDWFETTLGPDFNALHQDHFHLQSKGWGTCR